MMAYDIDGVPMGPRNDSHGVGLFEEASKSWSSYCGSLWRVLDIVRQH